jgi:hypothetical protein
MSCSGVGPPMQLECGSPGTGGTGYAPRPLRVSVAGTARRTSMSGAATPAAAGDAYVSSSIAQRARSYSSLGGAAALAPQWAESELLRSDHRHRSVSQILLGARAGRMSLAGGPSAPLSDQRVARVRTSHSGVAPDTPTSSAGRPLGDVRLPPLQASRGVRAVADF